MVSAAVKWRSWPPLVHSLRTAIAAVTSLVAARLFHLPQSYWAPITTLVITQSSLGAALTVSGQRFVGTLLGALLGGIVATYFGSSVVLFGICVFLLGLICACIRVDRAAYRFSGITVALVLLIPRAGTGTAWQVAFHRFAEVSIGIVVALIFAWVWPEMEPPASGEQAPAIPEKSSG